MKVFLEIVLSVCVFITLSFVIISSSQAADYQERPYVTSKTVYPVALKANFEHPVRVPGIRIYKGAKARLQILIPAGLNQLRWRPSSNTFQYGVRIGLTPGKEQSSSGQALMLYSNGLVKTTQGTAFVYIDNTYGTTDFVLLNSSELLLYAIGNANTYNTWRAGNVITPPPVGECPVCPQYKCVIKLEQL